MKKVLFIVLFVFVIINGFSNNHVFINSHTVLDCSENFYDTGGIDGNYSDNEDYIQTFCPDVSGDVVVASFNLFDVEYNYDFLYAYDGDSISSPLIGVYTGYGISDTLISSIANGGCLTFRFTSDETVNRQGWEVAINCSTPSSCTVPSQFLVEDIDLNSVTLSITDSNVPQATVWEIEYGPTGFSHGTGTLIEVFSNLVTISGLVELSAYDAYVRAVCSSTDTSYWSNVLNFTTNASPLSCGSMFYDSGGVTGEYSNNEDYYIVICPNSIGSIITVEFTSFNLENNFDFLYIYDGNNTTNLIGEYSGSNSPGTITSTSANGCLTFRFRSDSTETDSGWQASVYCGETPTCFTPSEVIVDGVSYNSVFLYIADQNTPPAAAWEIEYGVTGFTQGTGTIYSATSDFIEITGLSTGITYDAYIRAICGTDDESFWTSKITFTTLGVVATKDFNIDSFRIYPNPANKELTVQFKHLETEASIKVFNVQGQLLLSEKRSDTQNTLNIENLNKGVYFVKVVVDGQSFIKKFVKR